MEGKISSNFVPSNITRVQTSKVIDFIKLNYNYEGNRDTRRVKVIEIHNLFCEVTEDNGGISLHDFSQVVSSLGIRKIKRRGGIQYCVTPCTSLSQNHHFPGQNLKKDGNLNFHLVNIQGLISKKKGNKVALLSKVAELKGNRNILAITETHLEKGQHFDAETAENHLPGYTIIRTDRDTKYDITDEAQLKTRGGAMLMASPDLSMNKVKECCFSNGNMNNNQ